MSLAKVGSENVKKKEQKDTGFNFDNNEYINPATNTNKVFGHSFCIWQIQLSIKLFLKTSAGFRGVATSFSEMNRFINVDTVSYGCIRQWVLRMGLGLLHLPIEKRNDWIYIIDFSIQLGKERCLLILGVTKQTLLENGYALKHKQVRVLDIYVKEHFGGQGVYERLLKTRERTGTPCQIVSDKGADVRKGIRLFSADNQDVVETYDVTHMLGNLIKHHLEKDPKWIDLQNDLNHIAKRVQQTELSFLRPIAMRKKARWLNIKQEIEWFVNLYHYQDKSDYSLISDGCKIADKDDIFEHLKSKCKNITEQNKLQKELTNRIFTDTNSVKEWLKIKGLNTVEKFQTENAGKLRFDEKFGILNKHRKYIEELQQLSYIAESIKNTMCKEGMSLTSLQKIETLYDKITYPKVRDFFLKTNNSLQIEHSKCGIATTPLLCCSDIIESIFGRFKMKAKQSVGGIYQTVLSIVLFCNEITDELTNEILQKVKISDVEKWFYDMMGKSNLSKRKIAFK